MKKETLNKPNQLIATVSKSNITLLQKKAYNIFLKNAQNKIKFEDYKKKLFEISCSELHEIAGLKRNDSKYIKEELEDLMSIVVEIRDKDNKNNWKAFNLISYVEKKEDKYIYELNHYIINALKNQKFFTTLNLLIIKTLQSKYSIILYELAIRYQKYKIPKMSIEEIREITNTQNEYKRFFDFRKYVLDVACKEISEKTEIILSYTTEKIGRRIAFIEFEIKNNSIKTTDRRQLNFFDVPEIKELEELKKLVPEDCRTSAVVKIIKSYLTKKGQDFLKLAIEYTNKNYMKNYAAYLEKTIKNNWVEEEIEKEKIKAEQRKKEEEKRRKREQEKKKKEKELKEKAMLIFKNLSQAEYKKRAKKVENIPGFKKMYGDKNKEELKKIIDDIVVYNISLELQK